MSLSEKFKKMEIDLSTVGLQLEENTRTYFCTPKGAQIFGWAGIDGIHYCTIQGMGEMVFSVSPMNPPGDQVHPIARNMEDLLGLLLACGSMAAIEQAYMWDRDQFEEYRKNNPPSREQAVAMNTAAERFAIVPIADPFSYIKKLQAEFACRKVKDLLTDSDVEMQSVEKEQDGEWSVTYNSSFWSCKGPAGKEIPVKKEFFWGSERWYVPAVYRCGKGLVIDFCKACDPAELKAYIDKWDLLNESNHEYSKEQQEQMMREHPLHVEFEPSVILNGKELRRDRGCSVSWIPAECLNEEFQMEMETKAALEHYGLDLSWGWSIYRYSFRGQAECASVLKSLKLSMKRDAESVSGGHFLSPCAGRVITFLHPVTAVQHRLTVHTDEAQELKESDFGDDCMKYPRHYRVLRYTVDPEITGCGFAVQDSGDGDSPRRKLSEEEGPVRAGVSAVGIIGGADEEVMTELTDGKLVKTHAACSSLYFEPQESIAWYMSFRIRSMEDVEVTLL